MKLSLTFICMLACSFFTKTADFIFKIDVTPQELRIAFNYIKEQFLTNKIDLAKAMVQIMVIMNSAEIIDKDFYKEIEKDELVKRIKLETKKELNLNK